MSRALFVITSLVVVTLLFAIAAWHLEPSVKVQDVDAPPFHKVELPPASDSFAVMESHLHRFAGAQWLRQLEPNQGGALWIALVVLAAVGLDARRRSPRNRDLLLAQIVGHRAALRCVQTH